MALQDSGCCLLQDNIALRYYDSRYQPSVLRLYVSWWPESKQVLHLCQCWWAHCWGKDKHSNRNQWSWSSGLWKSGLSSSNFSYSFLILFEICVLMIASVSEDLDIFCCCLPFHAKISENACASLWRQCIIGSEAKSHLNRCLPPLNGHKEYFSLDLTFWQCRDPIWFFSYYALISQYGA